MRQYTKIIILSSILLVVIVLITLAMVFDVDLLLFKSLSIAGIQEKKLNVEMLIINQYQEEEKYLDAKNELQTSKNNFDVAKEAYENIDESTISIVQEATKEEKYFVEYLWIVLGNYATTNNVGINILTPGATNIVETDEKDEDNKDTDKKANETEKKEENTTTATLKSGIKITVEGRYADVADFVFDVENDKSLKFKLDNIKMTYSGDNKIEAMFDVLSLSVLK